MSPALLQHARFALDALALGAFTSIVIIFTGDCVTGRQPTNLQLGLAIVATGNYVVACLRPAPPTPDAPRRP